jgi:hypothetical protein
VDVPAAGKLDEAVMRQQVEEDERSPESTGA